MFFLLTSRSRLSVLRALALAVVALTTQAAGPATAQAPAWGSKLWPWNVGGYQGHTPPPPPGAAPRGPETIRQDTTPRWYTLQITVLPVKTEENPTNALLVAHVPDDAEIWFDEAPTTQKGTLRQFVSPSLAP